MLFRSVQQLRSLSTPCTIQMGEDGHYVNTGNWESLPSYIDFVRRSKSASLRFRVGLPAGKIFYLSIESFSKNHQAGHPYLNTYFYVGNQEASVTAWSSPTDIKQLKQHLTQTGHNLKFLSLGSRAASSFSGKDVFSSKLQSFLHDCFRSF